MCVTLKSPFNAPSVNDIQLKQMKYGQLFMVFNWDNVAILFFVTETAKEEIPAL